MKLAEVLSIDLNVGDEILVGKFKNKKEKVKTWGFDDKGQLIINGRKAFTFRIVKAMEKKK